ncbi:hypothetical protein, partial [Alteromonas stellipolaris]|uniref:hypothetical protein n=1 Tax=Alteromonas stellipolaris TaxID=233316 RepID=UPI001D4F9134
AGFIGFHKIQILEHDEAFCSPLVGMGDIALSHVDSIPVSFYFTALLAYTVCMHDMAIVICTFIIHIYDSWCIYLCAAFCVYEDTTHFMCGG